MLKKKKTVSRDVISLAALLPTRPAENAGRRWRGKYGFANLVPALRAVVRADHVVVFEKTLCPYFYQSQIS